MESCLGQKLPELRGSLPDGSASEGDLYIWKVEAERVSQGCYKRHQDLIDFENKRLLGRAPAPAAEGEKKEEGAAEQPFWRRFFK